MKYSAILFTVTILSMCPEGTQTVVGEEYNMGYGDSVIVGIPIDTGSGDIDTEMDELNDYLDSELEKAYGE